MKLRRFVRKVYAYGKLSHHKILYVSLFLLIYALYVFSSDYAVFKYIFPNRFQLISLYEYYNPNGYKSAENESKPLIGLNVENPNFTLNGKEITLYSGAMHYFRVPKAYWRDRLRKMRAAGLNAVETYIPWNLHEPQKGWFDFGQGGSDFEEFLDLPHFLQLAKEEDLFAIVRPGPFICAEWEYGGLPSWLLRDKGIKVRTSDERFLSHVTSYFNVLLPILALLQFTKGGPVIAFQIENEYASGEYVDMIYLHHLKNLMLKNDIKELLFTSDGAGYGNKSKIPGVLQTVNLGEEPENDFQMLQKFQPKKPVMAMEYWMGWFDHWSENHHTTFDKTAADTYERILKYPASVNIYMFHGGTNWGFLNGANLNDGGVDNKGFEPTTTSYDYDAPLNEAGDYTEKYVIIKELLLKYNKIKTRLPLTPAINLKANYQAINITHQLKLEQILEQIEEKIYNSNVIPMELLNINNNSGQSYGYVVYRKVMLDIPANSVIRIGGRPCDGVIVLVNGYLMSKPLHSAQDLNGFGYWRFKNGNLTLGSMSFPNATLEILVENWGRVNFGNLQQLHKQYKGLWQGQVYLNNRRLTEWEIVPMQFKRQWSTSLKNWHALETPWMPAPTLYKTVLNVQDPQDTFINMRQWTKGIVIVNGFVLGRYCSVLGPQQTLYLPAPLLKSGDNEILVFEHFSSSDKLLFSDKPIYVTP